MANQRVRDLTVDEREQWFRDHLKQRYTWLITHRQRANQGDALFDGECAFNECAYAAGMLAARFFIQFLGLKVKNSSLAEGREWFVRPGESSSYEVKVVDLGGQWVEIDKDLQADEGALLARIWSGVNQGVAHLSDGSSHGFKWEKYGETIDIVVKLLKKRLFDVVKREPDWHGKGWKATPRRN